MRLRETAAILTLPVIALVGCSSHDDTTSGSATASTPPSSTTATHESPSSPSTSTASPQITSHTPRPHSSTVAPTTTSLPSPIASSATRTNTPATDTVTRVRSCYTPAVVRPSDILIACADGGEGVTSVRWTTWGPSSATGRGTHFQRVCEPNCAEGYDETTPVTVRLSTPVRTGRGTVFSLMTVTGQQAHTVQLVTAD